MTDSITCDTPTQISGQSKTLQLANNFQPDVDLLVGEGPIAFGVKVLMRQTLDIDLNRYSEYIHNATPHTKKAIQAFPTGKAIVSSLMAHSVLCSSMSGYQRIQAIPHVLRQHWQSLLIPRLTWRRYPCVI